MREDEDGHILLPQSSQRLGLGCVRCTGKSTEGGESGLPYSVDAVGSSADPRVVHP